MSMSMFDLAKRAEFMNPMSESNIEVNNFLFSNWELKINRTVQAVITLNQGMTSPGQPVI